MEHIKFEHLISHLEGSLSAANGQPVAEHLGLCRVCATESRKLGNFLAYFRQHDFEQVSQAVTANLLNIYTAKKATLKNESFIKKLVANLVFDDWQIALKERFVSSDTRQLLYRADNFDIDLRLRFAGDKCHVSGQVFPDCRHATAEIFSKDLSERISLNQDCEFVFRPLKTGVYGLRINSVDTIVEIRDISLLI